MHAQPGIWSAGTDTWSGSCDAHALMSYHMASVTNATGGPENKQEEEEQ